MKKLFTLALAAAFSVSVASAQYKLVTDVATLDNATECIIGSANEQKAMGTYQATAYRVAATAEIGGGVLKAAEGAAIVAFTKTEKGFLLSTNGGYLYAKGGNNRLGTWDSDPTDDCYANITITDGNALIEFGGTSEGRILTLTSDGASYKCFPTVQLPVQIYKYDENASAEKKDPVLSFSERTFSVLQTAEFTAPELNNPDNLVVTYSSSNEAVATVDASTGAVTIVGGGVTSIMASFAGNDDYNEGFATYTLTVVPVYTKLSDLMKSEGNILSRVDFDITVNGGAEDLYFVTDGESYGVLTTAFGIKAGDVVPAGWDCNMTETLGMRAILPSNNFKSVVETVNIAYRSPVMAEITEDDLYRVFLYDDVVISENTPVSTADKVTFEGGYGEGVLNFASILPGLESKAPGKYQVLAAVVRYNEALVLMPLVWAQPLVAPTLYVGGDAVASTETKVEFEREAMLYFDDFQTGSVAFYRFTEMTENEGDPLNPSDELLTSTNNYKEYDDANSEIISVYVRGLLQWYALRGEEKSVVKRMAFFLKSNGVEVVDVETGEVKFFDLQGRNVVNPEKGLYIRLSGNKAEKVIL